MGILFGQEKRAAQAFPVPPIPAFLGADPYSGKSTVNDSALTVPTVWACVNLVSNAVSMLPLETFSKASVGGVPVRTTDPDLVRQPAARMTQSSWLHVLVVSLLLRGNFFGLVVARDDFGFPTQIEPLNPDKVRVQVDGGRVQMFLDGSTVDRAADIWHVPGLVLPGSVLGLSPISYAAATLGVDLSSRAFASGFFSDGSHPSAILSTEQPVNQDQATAIKTRFRAAIVGREPAVLGAGVKYTPIQVSPEESQFLETQQANVAQIARFFGIPPEMVGGSGGGSMTYANVEQRSLDFLTYCLSPWLKRIEDAMFGLFDASVYVRFNTAALLRTDAKTQAEVDQIQIASKVRAPSEVRHSHDWAPMTDAQKAELDEVKPPKGDPFADPKPASLPAEPVAARSLQVPQPIEVRATIPVEVNLPPSVVNVAPAEVRAADAAPINITVEPTPVHVDVAPAAVTVVPAKPSLRTVVRDDDGNITHVMED